MTYLHHESCPKCGSRDNLARYSDGSAWCFGCRYYERATGQPRFQRAEPERQAHAPPEDIDLAFSGECIQWLAKYGIPLEELHKRNVRWSASRDQLVFLMGSGVWQARNFNKQAKTKYFTQGAVNDHLPIYRSSELSSGASGDSLCGVSRLVLVEDCISAIKIARQCDAMPLLGSSISYTKLARIGRFYKAVTFWLDADKYKEAQGLSTRARLIGLDSRVIYTEEDPKCYNDEQIKEYLK